VTTCQVRWIDIDAYKHVNNTVFLRYLEQARLELFGHVPAVAGQPPPTGPDAEPTDSFVIAELEATYKRPLLLRPKPVYVHSWTTHLGNSSFHLTHALVDDQHEYLVGVARMVCINRESTRPRPLRAHEREILERYRMDPTARR
jgi:acyl-CoA thioester hydrolase